MKYLAMLLCMLAPVLAGRCAEYEWTAPKLASNSEVSLRLWIPDGLETAKGIIVLIPGRDGDGRPMAADPEWRELAERTQCALLACKMKGSFYQTANVWSGVALVDGISALGSSSKHTALFKAPLYFYGHSAGANFSASFLSWRPDRVGGAVIVNAGYDKLTVSEDKARMPTLWILGENDSEAVREGMTEGFSKGRRAGGPWVFALQPGVGHELGKARPLAIEFFNAILGTRRSAWADLRPWVGDLRTHEIAPAASDRPDGALNSWLPGEQFAQKWRDFVTGTNSAP